MYVKLCMGDIDRPIYVLIVSAVFSGLLWPKIKIELMAYRDLS
jgi:hypothetical protein